MEYLDSVGFVVNSLSQIANMIETNADGISKFGVSIFRLIFRIKDWNISLFRWIKKML